MIKNYIKIAFKVFMRRKFFTAISLFAISFTLVVLMATVSILDQLFAPMAPETRQERTLGVYNAVMRGKDFIQAGDVGYGFLSKYVKTLPDAELVSIYSRVTTATSFKDGFEIKSDMKLTDGEFWKILDFKFLEGGPITDADETNANFVAVINQATKQKFFGDASALGKSIEANGQRFRIVGVVSNVPVYRDVPYADIWVPISTTLDVGYRERLMSGFRAMILARDRADFDRIRSEFNARLKKVALPSSNYDTFLSVAESEFDRSARDLLGATYSTDPNRGDITIPSDSAEVIGLLILAAFLFMLLPTINLVNINVSRIIERASEIGVRKSFGASSRTLIGQFLVENILLTLIGGIVGFILSVIILNALTSSGLIPYADFHVNVRIFLYGLAVTLIFGTISGVYPAWRMSRMQPVNALKGIVR
ncbi:MAG TPA: FtsX-like permease family protein [Bacteroidota bacterium]|nr:FtsX-like permease family protein [Bacteroidota bacterium]